MHRWISRGLLVSAGCMLGAEETESPHPAAIDVGERLELFADGVLSDRLSGEARLRLHQPIPRDVVFRTDAPWEGNASGYQTIFQDEGLYRMYYRGGHYKHGGEPAEAREPHDWVLCYAESTDGIQWTRPDLGICTWEGATANNIVVDTAMVAAIGGCPAHTAVFRDTNPECPPDQRYKIILFGRKPQRGLYVMGSPDGLHFRLLSDTPIQTTGAFDSQNLVFWDPVRGEYRMYHRGFNGRVRDILTATSQDILHFPEPRWLQYPDSPTMALYTNQIQPYYRAPHILMGFPKRYCDRGWSEPMLDLPGQAERVVRASHSRRYGTTVTDAVFMASRDGLHFKRWSEAFIRPGPKQSESWVYGDNFIFWGMVETPSIYGDAPNDISLYVVEGYWEGTYTSVRRYTIRQDGFVSAYAPYAGGELLTAPIVFAGGNLQLNMATSAFGSLRVEIQNPDGSPIDGYTLEECPPILGDRLDHVVRWHYKGGDLRPLAGQPVRLRFELRDADVYSFQFKPYEPEPERPVTVGTGYIPPKNPDREPFVVLEDDFSHADAGTSPTEADLNPFVGDGEQGWTVMEGSPDRVQVLNDDPIGGGQAGKNHYLKVERRNENAHQGGRAWVNLKPQDAADSTNGMMQVEARILVPSTIHYCSDIDAFDSPPGEYTQRAFHVRFFPDGSVKYWSRDGHVDIAEIGYQPDEWTEVRITANLKAATFSLTVNGKTAENLPFASPLVHRIQCIALCPNTRDCVLYVDRVKVSVEP